MTEALGAVWWAIGRLAAAALIAAFALLVWPTRYRYDRMQLLGETTPGPVYPVRIDRITGAAEILMPEAVVDGRHHMKLTWVGQEGLTLPDSALAELRKTTLIDTEPLPYAQILNTTAWTITKLRWEVTGAARGGPGETPPTRVVDQHVVIQQIRRRAATRRDGTGTAEDSNLHVD